MKGDLNCQKGLDCFTSYRDFHIKTYNPWGFRERTFSIFPNHHGNVSHAVKLLVAKHHMECEMYFCKIKGGKAGCLWFFLPLPHLNCGREENSISCQLKVVKYLDKGAKKNRKKRIKLLLSDSQRFL